ncbi:MAG: hypothetical protein ACPGU5_05660 [Lishizhenia sp.]
MRYLFTLTISILLFSCSSNEDETQLLYSYLEECNQNYYENRGINANQELDLFYTLLKDENQLEQTDYKSLKNLLNYLVENTTFPSLQKIEIPQDHQFLNEPPQELFLCVNDLYAVDSLQFIETEYYQLENELLNYINETPTPSANHIWSIYAENLTENNYNIDFYKKNILMQLFRWYYVCKYENENLSVK